MCAIILTLNEWCLEIISMCYNCPRCMVDELKSHPFLVHFSDLFLSKKTDLCAEIWSN